MHRNDPTRAGARTGGRRRDHGALCAIHRLAPVCAYCGCKVLGHGMEAAGAFFCCASCARHAGEGGLADRAA